MTTEQALQVLTNATAQIQAPRAVHIEIMKAIEVLRAELQKKG